jgi:hypothetical protein
MEAPVTFSPRWVQISLSYPNTANVPVQNSARDEMMRKREGGGQRAERSESREVGGSKEERGRREEEGGRGRKKKGGRVTSENVVDGGLPLIGIKWITFPFAQI